MKKDIKKRLGFRPQLKDIRDRLLMPLHGADSLPPRVDLRFLCPPVLNQYELGSCVANSISSVFRFALRKQKSRDFQPSRLFLYYNARALQGWQAEDSGAYIRDGFKSLNRDGVCVESSWKYDIKKYSEKPPARTYKTAETHQAIEYQSVVQSLGQLKACLADGFPFVAGISVYESFVNVGKDGITPFPSVAENLIGGHAIYVCGYIDEKEQFICGNSWGKVWGDKGFFYLPYSYLTNQNLASDFWCLKIVES